MNKIIVIFCLCFSILKIEAQITPVVKPTSLAFHVFYIDFKTAQQIRASSLSDVLKNGKWSGFREMQMGFGLNYFKGINQWLDAAATLDGSGVDYLFKDGTTNGSSKFLFDFNAGLNVKLVNDSKPVAPYFFGGAGLSYYLKKAGLYFPVGLGVKFNLFNEAFITANMQYRMAATSAVNQHFYYTVGIGTTIGKKVKKAKSIEKEVVVVAAPIEVKAVRKDLIIKVVDDQTGIALPNAMVSLISESGTYTATTNLDGEAVFKNNVAGNYTINGTLNGINTSVQTLQTNNFDASGGSIKINLSHHDPRFTLTGTVEEKNTNMPMGGVLVSITDKTIDKTTVVENNAADGKFNVQLGANSDFVMSAKKVNYISNIESVSTKGLNRSTTLYVKFLLGIEETKANATINLKNIYYATGSSQIKQEASSDLDRLVLFLKDNPSVKIEIASHTDSRGAASKNLILSKQRAQEVVNYLKRKNINESRIIARGYGETKLLNECKDGVKCTEAQHEKNRRTEFKVISN
jgi:outer membrane protein OmpA-like peptidoglycan-associated protein